MMTIYGEVKFNVTCLIQDKINFTLVVFKRNACCLLKLADRFLTADALSDTITEEKDN